MRKNKMINWGGAAGLMVAVFGVASVQADILTEVGSIPTSGEVVTVTESVGFGDDADVSLAQTFTVDSAFSANHIWLEYETDTNSSADWTMALNIFAVSDVNSATLSTNGAALYTGLFTFTNYGDTETVVRLDLDSSVALSAGGYALVVTEASGGDFNPGWEWTRTTATEDYAAGAAYEDGVWRDTVRDFSLGISSIPEPATLGLMGAFAIGALLVRRFRL
jgi:hypothetical protein